MTKSIIETKTEYVYIALPESVTAKIDDFINQSRGAFSSRAEVVKSALQNFYKEQAQHSIWKMGPLFSTVIDFLTPTQTAPGVEA